MRAAATYERTPGCARAPLPGEYRRHEPEKTALWDLVARELDPLLSSLQEARPDGPGLPGHVERELRAYLDCGLLEKGFARLRCGTCGDEMLVAFSCKGRGVCPSCTTRRMHDVAAHLVDRVLPRIPMRQWVLTYPRRIRWHLAQDPKLLGEAREVFLRVLFAWQRRRARELGVDFRAPSRSQSARSGAITFAQRFGSSLELNVHLHSLVADGVFSRDPGHPGARPRFHRLPPPTDADVAWLLSLIAARTVALLRRRGRLDDDEGVAPDDIALRVAATPTRVRPTVEQPLPPLCARREGFSLHAGVAIHENDRQGLERLARYCLRPPLSLGRLSLGDDGRVIYRMKRRFSDGTDTIVLPAREFLVRLAALVPPPRRHLTGYHGIFAPRARDRAALTGRAPRASSPAPPRHASASAVDGDPGSPPAPLPSDTSSRAAPPDHHPLDHGPPDDGPLSPPLPDRARRLDWAALLARVHAIDVLVCARCSGPLRVLAFISDERLARHILDHLGIPPVRRPRAHAPPPISGSDDGPTLVEEHCDPPSAFD